ncbi:MAG: hypothetical protein JXQ87_15385 [Bacteroidia bacterium]
MNAYKYLFPILLLVTTSCSSESERRTKELTAIVEQLRIDSNKTTLKTLAPKASEYKLIFNSNEAIMKVSAYSNKMWGNIDKVPENSMKPEAENVSLKNISRK